jgi:hypothetical protein
MSDGSRLEYELVSERSQSNQEKLRECYECASGRVLRGDKFQSQSIAACTLYQVFVFQGGDWLHTYNNPQRLERK